MVASAIATGFVALFVCFTLLAQAEAQVKRTTRDHGRHWYSRRDLLLTVSKQRATRAPPPRPPPQRHPTLRSSPAPAVKLQLRPKPPPTRSRPPPSPPPTKPVARSPPPPSILPPLQSRPQKPLLLTYPTTTKRSSSSGLPQAPLSPVAERGGCVDAADALAATNSYRAQHDAPAMTWDNDLAASSEAFAWELYRRGDCKTAHSTDFTYGENVYADSKYPKQYSATCREAVDEWYYESLSFNFNTKQLFAVNAGKGLGHFTQLVWRSSTSMGCGVALADQPIVFPSGTVRSGGCKIVVCRYLPPGNVPTDKAYIENVLPPRR